MVRHEWAGGKQEQACVKCLMRRVRESAKRWRYHDVAGDNAASEVVPECGVTLADWWARRFAAKWRRME